MNFLQDLDLVGGKHMQYVKDVVVHIVVDILKEYIILTFAESMDDRIIHAQKLSQCQLLYCYFFGCLRRFILNY